MNALSISDKAIRQDSTGRYCINDLHRASGGADKHRPTYWLKLQQTKELGDELEKDGIPSIQSKQGLGTFVRKEMVYAYAMWISPKFHIRVIRAYDELASGDVPAVDDSELSTVKDRHPLYHGVVDVVVTYRLSFGKAYQAANWYAGVDGFPRMTKKHVREVTGFLGRFLTGEATQRDFERIETNRVALTGESSQLELISVSIPLIYGRKT